jgi:hypothetical protein
MTGCCIDRALCTITLIKEGKLILWKHFMVIKGTRLIITLNVGIVSNDNKICYHKHFDK